MKTNTTTGLTPAAQHYWNEFLDRLRDSQGGHVSEDDEGMSSNTEAEILAWVDDLEDRVGLYMANSRAAAIDYLIVRDGPDDPDMARHHADLMAAFEARREAEYKEIAREFGPESADELREDLPPLPAAYVAEPWHNDICPKWVATCSNGARVWFWAERREVQDREYQEATDPRFFWFLYRTEEDAYSGICVETISTEDPQQIPTLCRQLKARAEAMAPPAVGQ